MKQLEFGVIGLGRMGGGLAKQALSKNMKVVGFDLHPVNEELKHSGLMIANNYQDLIQTLNPPRIIFIYIPSGRAIDHVINELSKYLQKDDVIVDGGNSYWGDSIRRHQHFLPSGIQFVDLGTSGGVSGAEHGACFMVGGEESAVTKIKPILQLLSSEDAFVHAGPPGAGHFVKLVHNGIEYGMLEAIGEGMALLENCPLKIDIKNVLNVYNKGSVIRGWLMQLMRDAYFKEDGLTQIDSYVDDTGEVNWLVDDAMHMEVSVPVIALSVMQLINSRDTNRNAYKAIAMMRHAFGGHAYGHSQVSQNERYKGRIGEYYFNEEDPNTLIHSSEE